MSLSSAKGNDNGNPIPQLYTGSNTIKRDISPELRDTSTKMLKQDACENAITREDNDVYLLNKYSIIDDNEVSSLKLGSDEFNELLQASNSDKNGDIMCHTNKSPESAFDDNGPDEKHSSIPITNTMAVTKGLNVSLELSEGNKLNRNSQYPAQQHLVGGPSLSHRNESSASTGIELLLLPNIESKKISSVKLQSGNDIGKNDRLTSAGSTHNLVRHGNHCLSRVNPSSNTTKVFNRVNIHSDIKTQPLIVTTKKVASEVTQTTAKVSIGNTTISVPLLKPLSSSQVVQPISGMEEAHKNNFPTASHPQCQLNINKILNVKRKTKPTIVSLSQLQIKPVSTAKIVQAKVINKQFTQSLTGISALTSQATILTTQQPAPPILSPSVHSKTLVQSGYKKKPSLQYSNSLPKEECNVSNNKTYKKSDLLLNNSTENCVRSFPQGTIQNKSASNTSASTSNCAVIKDSSLQINSKMPNELINQKTTLHVKNSQYNVKSDCSMKSTVSALNNNPRNISLLSSANVMKKHSNYIHPFNTSMNENNSGSDQNSKKVKINLCTAMNTNSENELDITQENQSHLTNVEEIEISTPEAKNVRNTEKSMQLKKNISKDNILSPIDIPMAKRTKAVKENENKIIIKSYNKSHEILSKQMIGSSDPSPQIENTEMKNISLSEEKLHNPSTSTDLEVGIVPKVYLPTETSCIINSPLKPEENQNALLKQLLQNSSNSQNINPVCTSITSKASTSPSVSAAMCTQLISARKVINVRAPSLGLVSSLEAQLARPVIPPVPANIITPTQIQEQTTTVHTHINVEDQVKNKDYAIADTVYKMKSPIQIVSKETSFISNPNLNQCLLKSKIKYIPDRNHMLNEVTNSGLKVKVIGERNDLISKDTSDNTNLTLKGATITSKSVVNVNVCNKTNIKPMTKDLKFSEIFLDTKINTNLDTEKNNNQGNEMNVLQQNASYVTQQQPTSNIDVVKNCVDNNSQNAILENTLRDHNKHIEDAFTSKEANNRKKRKRDSQKHRRAILNKSKDSLISPFQNTFNNVNPKKKMKKMIKIDEDYDSFIDNMMIHIRHMETLEVIEPVLKGNFAFSSFYESHNKVNVANNKEFGTQNLQKWICGDYGTTRLSLIEDFYHSNYFNDIENIEKYKQYVMHNDFYDQEFVSFVKINEYNRFVEFIRHISGQHTSTQHIHNTINNKKSNNANKNVSLETSITKISHIISFPGMLIKNTNRTNVLDRMSPIIPHIDPFKSNVNFIPIIPMNKSETYESFLSDNNEGKKPTNSKTNQTVILSLPSNLHSNIYGVLNDLANLLNILPPVVFQTINEYNRKTLKHGKIRRKQRAKKSKLSSLNLQRILNGRHKICRTCGRMINEVRQVDSTSSTTESVPDKKTITAMQYYFCSTVCFISFKRRPTKEALHISNNNLKNIPILFKHKKAEINILSKTHTVESNNKIIKKVGYKYYSDKCSPLETPQTCGIENEVSEALMKMNITITPKIISSDSDEGNISHQYIDKRQCIFCNQVGDGVPDGPSRLLNYDVDKWVHLNCALWSNCVYETVSGGLMNFQSAVHQGLTQICSACQQLGATVKCCKNRCGSIFHLPCAIKEECVFFKNKTIHCQQHATGVEKENELVLLNVERRVYVERDETRQVNSVMHNPDYNSVLRIGNLIFLSVGHLLPHQMDNFHSSNYIYPVGYKIVRLYWSMKRPYKRCRYICSITELNGRPEFCIQVEEPMEGDLEIREPTAEAAWQRILTQICALRKENKMIQLYPQFLSGEELFGLTEPFIARIIESIPGIEALPNYRLKYGRNQLLDFPAVLNSTGSARTEPKQHQLLNCKKPHTQRTGTVCNQRANSASSAIAGEVACPYSKQFVHSKSSQYKKMKQEWRNNVYLARSKIQGLGLYAARDIEKHTMIIEYIGEIIRTEVSEIREKQYEAKNRGIYMFRLDEYRVVDATLSGGLARYINHSCNPNCVTETVEVDRELRIIIFAKRKINRGEELSYDYKFDIEDDAHKIMCMCTASNCRKWMN